VLISILRSVEKRTWQYGRQSTWTIGASPATCLIRPLSSHYSIATEETKLTTVATSRCVTHGYFSLSFFAVCMDDSGVVCTSIRVTISRINGRSTCQSGRRDPRVAEELKFDSSLDVALILISQALLDSRLVSSSISYTTRTTI